MSAMNSDSECEDDEEGHSPNTNSVPSSSSLENQQQQPLRVTFRAVRPTDMEQCYALEREGYPEDEAASKTTLQFRQHHAARYFRCAVISSAADNSSNQEEMQTQPTTENDLENTVIIDNDHAEAEVNNEADATNTASNVDESSANVQDAVVFVSAPATSSNNHDHHNHDNTDDDLIVGFVCATLCREFNHESLQTHVPSGPLLAIHSVVVHPSYRRHKIATQMLQDYVRYIQETNVERFTSTTCSPIESLVLMAKKELLTFYIDCGFSVIGKSLIEHGAEQWYHLEQALPKPSVAELRRSPSGTELVPTHQQQLLLQDHPDLSCYIVNAFADAGTAGSSGNPAAVVLLPGDDVGDGVGALDWNDDRHQAWMQMVAAEFNLSETAFVCRLPRYNEKLPTSEDDGNVNDSMEDHGGASHHADDETDAHFRIRYFTPTCQIALCGHATLASAAVIYETVLNTVHIPIYFYTMEPDVVLKAEYDVALSSGLERHSNITMKFPIQKALELEDEDSKREISKMLELAFYVQDRSDQVCILFIGFTDLGDLLVELTYESFIQIDSRQDHCDGDDSASSKIDYNALRSYDGYTRGVIVCCQAPSQQEHGLMEVEGQDMASSDSAETIRTVDFYSRFFAPKAGIDEDPVTGSAHATLAPYFCSKLSKDRVRGMQMSRRGGIVDCRMLYDASVVEISGLAVTVMSGSLFL
jgi:predicted PhzF superfamily epimerase YddE/YHI9/ribosomal protein S18 acetylase RimI-like enzyme